MLGQNFYAAWSRKKPRKFYSDENHADCQIEQSKQIKRSMQISFVIVPHSKTAPRIPGGSLKARVL